MAQLLDLHSRYRDDRDLFAIVYSCSATACFLTFSGYTDVEGALDQLAG